MPPSPVEARTSKQQIIFRVVLAIVSIAALFSIFGYRYFPVALDYFDDDSCIGCHRKTNGALRSSHAMAEQHAMENAAFQVAPAAMQRQGCLSCHSIGKTFDDGGRGRCNACHSAHQYSVQEAREPDACSGCHMGPDHPQAEAWEASKHGVVYRAVRDETVAPTCTSCHMGGDTGHDDSGVVTIGGTLAESVIAGDEPPSPMSIISREDFEAGRDKMLAICRQCHSAAFASRHLRDADEIKQKADGLLAEAVQIITQLEQEGLLRPMPQDRPPHPIAGHELVLGSEQLYSDTSYIEQLFFEMMKFHHPTTFKGAYHFSPDHTHSLGWVQLQAGMTRIRAEADRLRAQPTGPAPSR